MRILWVLIFTRWGKFSRSQGPGGAKTLFIKEKAHFVEFPGGTILNLNGANANLPHHILYLGKLWLGRPHNVASCLSSFEICVRVGAQRCPIILGLDRRTNFRQSWALCYLRCFKGFPKCWFDPNVLVNDGKWRGTVRRQPHSVIHGTCTERIFNYLQLRYRLLCIATQMQQYVGANATPREAFDIIFNGSPIYR